MCNVSLVIVFLMGLFLNKYGVDFVSLSLWFLLDIVIVVELVRKLIS